MGCDIHLNVERKVKDHESSYEHWINVPIATQRAMGAPLVPDPKFDEWEQHWEYEHQNYVWFAGKHVILPDWRNYTTFTLMANVRRRDVTPISNPRGLPKDCTWETRENCGDHSKSWLDLVEIINCGIEHEYLNNFYAATRAIDNLVEGNVRYVFGFDS
jgi:hypothetical protein